jgi:hypothetical protein
MEAETRRSQSEHYEVWLRRVPHNSDAVGKCAEQCGILLSNALKELIEGEVLLHRGLFSHTDM